MPDKALRTGRHCVFMLHAHLIFITKYRGKVLSRAMLRDMEKIMRDVCTIQGATLSEFNGEADHVHLLVEYPPTVQLS
ncbi:IS200/IS605 family transposase, partial [Thiolapillus sp.]